MNPILIVAFLAIVGVISDFFIYIFYNSKKMALIPIG